MKIVAIDPGLNYPAMALSVDGVLIAAERVKIPALVKSKPILDRCDTIAKLITNWLLEHALTVPPDVIIAEWPQWYGDNKKGIDPNDLAGLCGIAGAFVGRVRSLYNEHVTVLSPKPREVWGSVPKTTKGDPWSSPRGQMLERRLKPGERERIQAKHDALDAAGLALFADDRWKQRRLYPGAV